jgi:hypothetical protein
MNKPAVLLCAFSTALFGLPGAAMAYDDDPGYGPDRPRALYDGDRTWYGGRGDFGGYDRVLLRPVFYVPTQRYYGKGYTVSYRYIPVYRNVGLPAASSNFRTEAFHLETNEIPAWGANSPRLTVKDSKSGGRPAVTTIIRDKSSNRTPAKSPSEADLAVVSGEAARVESPAKP